MRRTTEAKPRILTCDPSFTAWGWAVLQGHLVVAYGCIKTEPEAKKRRIREGDDRVRRTSELITTLLRIVNKYKIKFITCELPHGSQNAKAAVMIGIVTGVMQTLADSHDIPIEWYSENDAKKALLGRKSASKREIQDAISSLYEVQWTGIKYKDEAVADALAVYFAAEQSSPILKYMTR